MIDPNTVPHFTLNDGSPIPCIGMGTFGSDRVSPDEVARAVSGVFRRAQSGRSGTCPAYSAGAARPGFAVLPEAASWEMG